MSQRNVAQYTSKTYAEHKAYWAKQASRFSEPFVFRQLEEFPSTQATRNTLRFSVPTGNGHAQEVQKLSAAGQLVVAVCTLYRLLRYYSGSTLPVVEIPGMQPDQIVPVGMELSPDLTLRDCLQTTQQNLKEAFTFADYPRQLAQGEEMGANVLVVSLPLHGSYPSGQEVHDLVLTLDTTGEAVVLTANYHTGVYEESFVQRLLAQWSHAFSWLATKESLLNDLTLWDTSTQEAILTLSQGKTADHPSSTVHQLFSQQANINPDKVAIHSAGLELTFGQVEAQANALGAYLLSEYKLAPGSTVGIMLHRSHLWPIAMLGVLKAGGAYLPIEPGFPESRRNHMLQDSQVAVLLTEMEFLFQV
ncbi:MAG: AMP-binding protein, partial [Bacteroidota bacterium]